VRPLIVDLGREYRGGQHQALLLLQGLRERGHAPELIAVRDSLLSSRAGEIGAPVHVADPKRRRLTAAWQIRRLARMHQVDLVHANEPHALSSAWLARAHQSIPIVVSRRIALPISNGYFSLARYRAASRIVAISHFVEQSIIRSGLPSEHVSVIYDGVEIPPEISREQRERARTGLGIARENHCIGNVAAFVTEKGHTLLLNAFAKLRVQFPDCLLLLRGEGPELAAVHSLAGRLHVGGAVKFLPASIDIGIMFAALDVFAFPSHEEPLGSALLAAMARALPVVAIARGGIPEVLEDGKNGLLTKDVDLDTFSSAIALLFSRPDEALRLGKAARETVSNRFSASRMVEESIRLYQDLAAVGSRLKSAS
jgi:glycosyltransferase involved in cell wall biosynthesis